MDESDEGLAGADDAAAPSPRRGDAPRLEAERLRSAPRPPSERAGIEVEMLFLEPDPASPTRARRWLEEVLGDEPPELVQAASLALTEAVTNVVLHARTPMELRLRPAGSGYRLEVVDTDLVGTPLLRRPHAGSSTGRGLLLLESVSDAWGVVDGAAAKTLWFEVGTAPGARPEEAPGPDPRRPASQRVATRSGVASGGERTIQLLGIPTSLLRHANEVYASLVRELWFVTSSGSGEAGEVVDAAAAVFERLVPLRTRLARILAAQQRALSESLEAGRSHVDLEHRVSEDLLEAWVDFDATLADAEGLCRSEPHTLVGSPDGPTVAFRRWIRDELGAQCAGRPPTAWRDSRFAMGVVVPRLNEAPSRGAGLGKLLKAEQAARSAVEEAERWIGELGEAAASVLTTPSLDEILGAALKALRESLTADASYLLLTTPEGEELVLRASSGDEPLEGPASHASEQLLAEVMARRAPVVLDRGDPGVRGGEGSSPGAFAAVPLFLDGQVVGVLAATSEAPGHFKATDTEVLAVLGRTLTPALDRVRQFERERSGRLRAERTAAQLQGLQRITAALAGAGDLGEVCSVLLRETVSGVEGMGASVLWVRREGRLVLMAGEPTVPGMRNIGLDEPFPVSLCARSGRPVFAEDRDEVLAGWPVFEGAGQLMEAFAALPLKVGGRVLGVLAVRFAEAHHFDADDRSYLNAVADQAAVALDRAQLDALERQARSRRELLAEATLALSLPGSVEEVLQRLAERAVPTIADCCAVLVPRGDDLERVALAWAPLLAGSPVPASLDPARPGQVSVALARRVPQLLRLKKPDVDNDPAAVHSVMVVPLSLGDKPVGAMLLAACGARPAYVEADLELATELGARATVIADQVLARARDKSLARSLMRAILPGRLPRLARVELAARYLPAESDAVGGDWYDAFELDDGRLALVVGDVSGHGVAASATMARLRNGLYAYAREGHPPVSVIERLQAILASAGEDHPSPQLLTSVTLAVLDLSAMRLEVANAGHPAWVGARGGVPLFGAGGGTVLAPGLPGSVKESSIDLEPGDLVLLYTDGLVERPGEPLDQGIARLAETAVAVAARNDLERACDALLERLLPAGLVRRDDCCLLAARLL